MDLWAPFSLVLQIIHICLLPKTSAQFQFMHSKCGNSSYYSPNGTYQSNLKTVLNSLSSTTQVTDGYYNFTAGQSPNKVEAMALCGGDVPVNTCRLCIRDSAATLPILCPNQREAFGYTRNCIIFYSNNYTFHVMRERPRWALWNTKNVSNIKGFNDTLTSLMSTLTNQASLGNSELKFAAAKANLTNTNQTIYGLVQCSPDLSRIDCVKCVQYLISSFFFKDFVTPTFIAAGARAITPSCNLRYENFSFYGHVTDVGPLPTPSQPSTPLASNRSTTAQVEKSKKCQNIIVVIIPIVGLLALIIPISSICILLRRKKQKLSTKYLNKEEETLQSLQYSLRAIQVATNDFSEDNYLGKGGFGSVYKGKLPDDQEIAVKRLARNSIQGDEQFKNEILLLAKLQHRNLVRLLGFCLEEEEMLLIYEFVINKSLDNFLFDPIDESSLQWETRWKIINGIARGLLYLHEDSRLRIIHRDLKADNVLLDSDFNPKIADFGMARLFNIDQTQAVATRVVGTYGYMAPEYVLHGRVSMKSDVYSFGVLLLEIVSGQRISSFQIGENHDNLLTFAWKNWLEGKAWNLVDPSLSPAFSTEIMRCIHIGLLCVQHNMADRPTMSSVELMLSSTSLPLQVPSRPAFFTRGHTLSNMTSQGNKSDQSTSRLPACSINEVSMTEVYPR